MQTLFLLLLAFTPIAIAWSKVGFSATALFFLAATAIVPLARFSAKRQKSFQAEPDRPWVAC